MQGVIGGDDLHVATLDNRLSEPPMHSETMASSLIALRTHTSLWYLYVMFVIYRLENCWSLFLVKIKIYVLAIRSLINIGRIINERGIPTG